MRFANSPTPDVSGRDLPRDHVDQALTEYFRSEMPSPWPAAPATVKPTASPRLPAHSANSGWGSRFALAASIALILFGAWLLSGSFNDVGPTGSSRLNDPSADTKNRGTLELIQDKTGPTKVRITFPDLP